MASFEPGRPTAEAQGPHGDLNNLYQTEDPNNEQVTNNGRSIVHADKHLKRKKNKTNAFHSIGSVPLDHLKLNDNIIE